jgi:hypothetical protein
MTYLIKQWTHLQTKMTGDQNVNVHITESRNTSSKALAKPPTKEPLKVITIELTKAPF